MFRPALRAAAPAMLLAFVVMLPFWNKPFTIDDYVFLREAGQALVTPLNPTAVSVSWSEDLLTAASKIVPTGPIIAWLLVPVALTGYAEWAGHAIFLAIFLASILGTAMLALRLGCKHREALLAALLVAGSPAALAMSGTLMPDVPSLALAVFGIDRILVWRESQRTPDAIMAGLLLGLGILTRTHLVLLLPVAALFMYRRPLWRIRELLPVWVAIGVVLLGAWITRDTGREGGSISSAVLSYAAVQHVRQNIKAFFIDWTLATPFVAAWLLYTWRRRWTWCILALAAAGALAGFLRAVAWYPVPLTILGFGMMADLGWRIWQRRGMDMAALYAWLWVAFPVVLYVHMPSKYLLPSLPAAAILLVRFLPVPEFPRYSWATAAAMAGFAAGALMLYADTEDGKTTQAIVREHIVPRVAKRERVWSVGHWGYQWYAERAGARTAALNRMPAKSEVIVVNEAAECRLMDKFANRVRIASYTVRRYGPQVMSRELGAGFYTNSYGVLPLAWGTSETRIDLLQLR